MKHSNKNNNDIDDQMIRDLFKDFSPEKAPDSLKQSTMNQVFQDWGEHPVVYKPIINKTNRWWIIGGFMVLLSITFLTDSSLLVNYWNSLNINNSLVDLNTINKSLGSVGSTIKTLPTIVYFIAIGIIALLGIDRLFNRLANI